MSAKKPEAPPVLQTKQPKCFDSQAQWNAYREVAIFSARQGFTYCSDCTPEYQGAMKAQGRCAFPRSTFYTVQGVLRGRRVTAPKSRYAR